MLEFFKTLLSSRQSIPQGHCYLWQPELARMHVVSGLLIALAYYSIPAIPSYFVGQCRDVPLSWIFLFGALVISCNTGHQMEVWNLWYPQYWLCGGIKAITAGICAYTALELVPLLRKALALPSPAQLEAANVQLETELKERPQVQIRQQESEKFLPAFMTEPLIALLC